jgi:hypothetical protein
MTCPNLASLPYGRDDDRTFCLLDGRLCDAEREGMCGDKEDKTDGQAQPIDLPRLDAPSP